MPGIDISILYYCLMIIITIHFYRFPKRNNFIGNKDIDQNCAHYARYMKHSNSVYGFIE